MALFYQAPHSNISPTPKNDDNNACLVFTIKNVFSLKVRVFFFFFSYSPSISSLLICMCCGRTSVTRSDEWYRYDVPKKLLYQYDFMTTTTTTTTIITMTTTAYCTLVERDPPDLCGVSSSSSSVSRALLSARARSARLCSLCRCPPHPCF